MGVKDLWSVLSPISQKVTLYDLQDKVVAVDLSCWVCEGQSIGEKAATTQPRMYLRNLFFRTYALLLMNVTPIFILEGDAPALKLDAMRQRNDARFKRYQTAADDEPKNTNRKQGGRSRFKGILKHCRDMLELMGVTCLQSAGEAEALCGQLSRDGLVDAVITQDSDVFLYGATTVYRNLAIKAGTGIVEVYKMSEIECKLNLSREKLVAMSLLCGCDYDLAGVHGVGKEMAYNYLSTSDCNVLQRLKELRNDRKLKRFEEEKIGCTKCCHSGKLSEHKKEGCVNCGLEKGCTENSSPLAYKNLHEDEKKRVTLEMNLRRKAISDPCFPSQDTINEYLCTRQKVENYDPSWKKPNICRFARFCNNMMEWELDYGFEKLLPMLTRWLLLKLTAFEGEELVPRRILKKRVLKGVPSFDLGWEINDENLSGFLALMPEDSDFLSEGLCVSIEPQLLVADKLPDLYAAYIEKTTKKKPPKIPKEKKAPKVAKEKKPKKNVKAVDELEELSIDECEPVLAIKSLSLVTEQKLTTFPLNSGAGPRFDYLNEQKVLSSSPITSVKPSLNRSFESFESSIIRSDTPTKLSPESALPPFGSSVFSRKCPWETSNHAPDLSSKLETGLALANATGISLDNRVDNLSLDQSLSSSVYSRKCPWEISNHAHDLRTSEAETGVALATVTGTCLNKLSLDESFSSSVFSRKCPWEKSNHAHDLATSEVETGVALATATGASLDNLSSDQLSFNETGADSTVVLSDESTVDYDISGILDGIIARRCFY